MSNKFNLRIFGGNEAEPHEFPFLVRMNKKVGGGLSVCGASILSNRWIITGKLSSLDLENVGWDSGLIQVIFSGTINSQQVQKCHQNQIKFLTYDFLVFRNYDNIKKPSEICENLFFKNEI